MILCALRWGSVFEIPVWASTYGSSLILHSRYLAGVPSKSPGSLTKLVSFLPLRAERVVVKAWIDARTSVVVISTAGGASTAGGPNRPDGPTVDSLDVSSVRSIGIGS